MAKSDPSRPPAAAIPVLCGLYHARNPITLAYRWCNSPLVNQVSGLAEEPFVHIAHFNTSVEAEASQPRFSPNWRLSL